MSEQQTPQKNEQKPDPDREKHDPMVVRNNERWLEPARTPRDWERRRRGL